MRAVGLPVGVALLLALSLVSCGRPVQPAMTTTSARAAASSRPGERVAAPVDPDPRVGALFFSGDDTHTCTGSVLHSIGGDLLLTAAHCLAGRATATTFVPGFAGNAQPADIWTVAAVYLDPRWLAAQDPRADYAIVRVSRDAGGSLEGQVGAGLSLGTAPAAGSQITVIGYPAGTGGMPIGCRADTGVNDGGYPTLPCAGLVDGTSGAPWVSGSTVTGVIGGLDGGGCEENVSYSAPFDEHTAALLARAQAGGPGDVAPADLGGDC